MRRRLIPIIGLLICGCGIPIDAEPQQIQLVDLDSPVPEVEVEAELATVTLYLVESGRLSPVTRDLPVPISPDDQLVTLVEGTTRPESRAGLRTSIPPGTEVLGVSVENGVATVDLSRGFANVGGEEEILAVAQVVLTLTSRPEIEAVSFSLEGVPTDVPLPDGALSENPVTGSDYSALISA